MKAYIFPGQGAQKPGMGKDLYDSSSQAKALFEKANEILGFEITKVMFEGNTEDLKQTNVTQPAIFLHSVILFMLADVQPDMVAGHSLGEFSALVANKCLSFEDGLRLVAIRANAMQKACVQTPSTMAAIIGLDDQTIESTCQNIDEVVVAANYNCPGQVVISGTHRGIEIACNQLKEAGARMAMPLQVGGAFHSPLMQPAREELAEGIEQTHFEVPTCSIYQNCTAQATSEAVEIKRNLIAQLTAPVRWAQSVKQMHADGATEFVECGPGNVLQGLVRKILSDVHVSSLSLNSPV